MADKANVTDEVNYPTIRQSWWAIEDAKANKFVASNKAETNEVDKAEAAEAADANEADETNNTNDADKAAKAVEANEANDANKANEAIKSIEANEAIEIEVNVVDKTVAADEAILIDDEANEANEAIVGKPTRPMILTMRPIGYLTINSLSLKSLMRPTRQLNSTSLWWPTRLLMSTMSSLWLKVFMPIMLKR